MTASGIVRALAILWVMLVGEAVIEAAYTGHTAWLPGGPVEELEPHNQEVRFGAVPEMVPAAHLQVALVQLDSQGCEEALLCAQSMPLLLDHSRKLYLRFRDYREFRHPRNIPFWVQDEQEWELDDGAVHAFRFGMLPADFIGTRVTAMLNVAYGGASDGVHDLQVAEGCLRGGSRRDGFHDQPDGDLLSLGAMQIRDGGCVVQLCDVLDVAVVIRVSSQPVADELCATRVFWREAVAGMAAKSFIAGEDDEVHPNVDDAALAAVVFRDAAIVDRLRDEHSSWFETSTSKWAYLLSARWDRTIESPFDLYPRVRDLAPDRAYVARSKSVQRDPADVAELDSWLVVYYPDSWLIIGLLALLAMVLVARAPATAKAHILICPSGLFLLMVTHFVELAGVTGGIFGLVFLIMLLPRMPRGTDGMYRVLAMLGVLASIAWVMCWVVAPKPDPAFVAFAVLGRVFCWIVVARWVVTDPTWRMPRLFVLFLMALFLAAGVSVLNHLQVLMPWLQYISIGALSAAGLLLVGFCIAGRHRGSRPESDLALATAAT
ncbi:MAG: hypothetical protein ACJAYX_001338 [Planctomycetota bacterium]|jgi:hypothetical protein